MEHSQTTPTNLSILTSRAISFFKVNMDLKKKKKKFSYFSVLQLHIWQQHDESKHNLTVNYIFYFEIWFVLD
jgi:hypothetical protein